MTKYILFSEPRNSVLEEISSEIFIKPNMKVAYIPSDGSNKYNFEYESFWKIYIENHGSIIVPINNSLRGASIQGEINKIFQCDAIILTGGNTFHFLNHLKESGLDKAVIEFAKNNKIIVGFSAGAIVLSPSIEIAGIPTLDENYIGISDLSALNLIKYDIFPHYEDSEHKSIVDEYQRQKGREVKRLTNDEVIIFFGD